MRNSLIFALLATISMPAFAAPDDRAAREAARAERQADRDEARSERKSEQQQAAPRAEPAAQQQRPVDPRGGNRPVAGDQQGQRNLAQPPVLDQRGGPNRGGGNPGGNPNRPALVDGNAPGDSVRDWRSRERHAGDRPVANPQQGSTSDEWRSHERHIAVRPQTVEQRTIDRAAQQAERRQRIEARTSPANRRPPVISRVPREGTQPPPRASDRPSSLTARSWNHNWRSDGHHDWQNHRRHHRSLFHLGFYFDPFGWGYRPYSIGWRMWPSYYGNSYWLNDPYMYRLPYAPAGPAGCAISTTRCWSIRGTGKWST